MKKIIFLDFDGVIAYYPLDRFIPIGKSGRTTYSLKPEAVARINQIIEKTGAKVVISSAWRKFYHVDDLLAHLQEAGFIGEVIGMTPDYNDFISRRGFECHDWLKTHGGRVETYVVIDDIINLDPIPEENRVVIERGMLQGIQDHHVAKAIRVLNGEV